MNNLHLEDETCVLDAQEFYQNNVDIIKRNQNFSKFYYNINTKDIKFPELVYTAEVQQLGSLTSKITLEDLQSPTFFAECISDGINRIQNSQYDGDIITYLYTKDIKFLREVIKLLGYGITGCDHENSIALIYYSLCIGIDIKIDLNLRNYIVITPEDEIIAKYESTTGKNWEMPSDKATIIYAFFNKCNLPIKIDYTKSQKYKELLNMPAEKIYRLWKYIYSNNTSLLPPIRYICSLSASSMEKYLDWKIDDLISLMIKIEYLPIEFITYKDNRFYNYSQVDGFINSLYKQISNSSILVKCFLKNLIHYKYVIERNTKIIPSEETLNQLTDLELINYYKPELNHKNRNELVSNIKLALKKPHWRVNYPGKSVNIDLNMISLEPRISTHKDPLISYGTLNNYISYNLSELTESFADGKFLKPDAKNVYDVFPYSDMNELKELVPSLSDIIEKGLGSINDIKLRIQLLKEFYMNANQQTKNKCEQIIFHIFFTGLYAKYWKGPGYDYPHIWSEEADENRSDYTTREVNCNNIFKSFFTTTNDEKLEDWKRLLPRINYSWKEKTYIYGIESIYGIILTTYEGQFCLSNYSNIGMETGYSLMKLVLGFDDIKINQHMSENFRQAKYKFCPDQVTSSTHTDFSIKFKNF